MTNEPQPMTDDQIRLAVMRWANEERRIARASLRAHVNRVRAEYGMPTVEREALRGIAVATAAVFAAFRKAVRGSYATALGSAYIAAVELEREANRQVAIARGGDDA